MKSFLEKLKLGEVIPYFSLPSSKNGNVNPLGFEAEKNLVLVFHHGNNCVHCWKKLKELAEAHGDFKEREAEILAVSFDNLETLRLYAEKIGIPFHGLSDETGETTEKFTYTDVLNHAPFPSIFIADWFGVLRH